MKKNTTRPKTSSSIQGLKRNASTAPKNLPSAAQKQVLAFKQALNLDYSTDVLSTKKRAGTADAGLRALQSPIIKKLCTEAMKVRKHAKAPYSHFAVGAAVLCADGSIVPGVNVESSSYGLTICAERSALVSAFSQGKTNIVALAVSADTDTAISPCGACRQLLFDYCPDALVLMMSRSGHHMVCTVQDLLPSAFSADELPKSAK